MSNEFRFPSDRTFVIAEIGVNHNGSLEMAKELIDVAAVAGCDAVKFQKRTPHMHVKHELWNTLRDTPWGEQMTHIDYRQKIELSGEQYQEIVAYCAEKKILFSASPWDCNAADTVANLGAPFFKIASASLPNLELLQHVASYQRPVVMSTGMSDLRMICAATEILLQRVPQLALLVCTSKYPAPVEDLNLSRINRLRLLFPDCMIGYSGHEPGLWTTLCAVAMGAKIIERHITLDRTLKGSDHAASLEPHGITKLVKEIRQFEKAKGSGIIRILDCEKADIARLRGATNQLTGATQEPPCVK